MNRRFGEAQTSAARLAGRLGGGPGLDESRRGRREMFASGTSKTSCEELGRERGVPTEDMVSGTAPASLCD